MIISAGRGLRQDKKAFSDRCYVNVRDAIYHCFAFPTSHSFREYMYVLLHPKYNFKRVSKSLNT